jgi:hypothetical protein
MEVSYASVFAVNRVATPARAQIAIPRASNRPSQVTYCLFGLARCLAAALVPSPGLPGFQGGEEGEGLPLRLTHVFPRFAGHFTPSTITR